MTIISVYDIHPKYGQGVGTQWEPIGLTFLINLIIFAAIRVTELSLKCIKIINLPQVPLKCDEGSQNCFCFILKCFIGSGSYFRGKIF